MTMLEASSQAVDSRVIFPEAEGEHFDHLFGIVGVVERRYFRHQCSQALEYRGDHTDFLVWPSIPLSIK